MFSLLKPKYTEIHLKIIATSDLHGYFFPYDLISNLQLSVSLAQISQYVKVEREKKIKKLFYLIMAIYCKDSLKCIIITL
jgi:2',3'-cyclic-nucleotide 2'-phosphodiesterase/3'-nucleotidase